MMPSLFCKQPVFLSAYFAALLLHVLPAYAAITSTGDVTPTYNGIDDPWNVPDDILYIGNTTSGSILINQGSVVNSYSSIVKNGTATVTGSGTIWNHDDLLKMGNNGSSTLSVTNGAEVHCDRGWVGVSSSEGFVTVSGNGSALICRSFFQNQSGDDGSFRIEDGGRVSSPDFLLIADTTVTGAGSAIEAEDLTIDGYKYTVTIENGAAIRADSIEIDGGYNTSLDYWTNLNVTGPGSSLELTGTLHIGFGGNSAKRHNRLRLSSGGVAHVTGDIWAYKSKEVDDVNLITLDNGTLNTGGLIATPEQLTGTGTINTRGLLLHGHDITFDATHGLQQQWVLNNTPGQNITLNLDLSDPSRNHGTLGAGYLGTSSMTIADGMNVTSAYGVIGYDNGHTTEDVVGTVTVTGPGSTWNITASLNENYPTSDSRHYADALVLGGIGTGVLNIEDGGTVNVHGKIAVRAGSEINLINGTLDLNSHQLDGRYLNMTGGTLKNAGYIVTGDQPFVQRGGTLAPGHPVYVFDRARIAGDYHLESGAVEIKFGGGINPHDQIVSEADLIISDTGIELKLVPLGGMDAGYYSLLYSEGGQVDGEFEVISGMELYEDQYEVVYGRSGIMIRFDADFSPGDLDGDGHVGLSDLDLILNHWNQEVTPGDWSMGDGSGDGFVGLRDLDGVLKAWNQGTPPTDATAHIPEPGALAIGCLGASALIRQRGYRTRQG